MRARPRAHSVCSKPGAVPHRGSQASTVGWRIPVCTAAARRQRLAMQAATQAQESLISYVSSSPRSFIGSSHTFCTAKLRGRLSTQQECPGSSCPGQSPVQACAPVSGLYLVQFCQPGEDDLHTHLQSATRSAAASSTCPHRTFLLVSCSSPPMMNSSRMRYTCNSKRLLSGACPAAALHSSRAGSSRAAACDAAWLRWRI